MANSANTNSFDFDVIIIGGSYAGLSAAMALGRSLRRVLIIDSGLPCNRQTPHSHNFITQDGERPAIIREKAKTQVLEYDTVQYKHGLAVQAHAIATGFEVRLGDDSVYTASKLLFATGVTDEHSLPGFAECWGISALHCPYCHGYEVRGEELGVVANGEMAFEFAQLISNWTGKLTVFTNGPSEISEEKTKRLLENNIRINEKVIAGLEHNNGEVDHIRFEDGTRADVEALFVRAPFTQHCAIPEELGCELTPEGLLKVDEFKKTSVPGVYAAGDNSSMLRAVSVAVASGTLAGAMINHEMIGELGN